MNTHKTISLQNVAWDLYTADWGQRIIMAQHEIPTELAEIRQIDDWEDADEPVLLDEDHELAWFSRGDVMRLDNPLGGTLITDGAAPAVRLLCDLAARILEDEEYCYPSVTVGDVIRRFRVDGWTVGQDYPTWGDRPAGEPAHLIVSDLDRQETFHVRAVPEDLA